jgi:hypothetical protein
MHIGSVAIYRLAFTFSLLGCEYMYMPLRTLPQLVQLQLYTLHGKKYRPSSQTNENHAAEFGAISRIEYDRQYIELKFAFRQLPSRESTYLQYV